MNVWPPICPGVRDGQWVEEGGRREEGSSGGMWAGQVRWRSRASWRWRGLMDLTLSFNNFDFNMIRTYEGRARLCLVCECT